MAAQFRPCYLIATLMAAALVSLPSSGMAKPESQSIAGGGQGFIENKGQWPEEVLFLHSAPGIAVWLTRDGIVIDRFTEIKEPVSALQRGGLLKDAAMAPSRVRGTVLRARFVNASSSAFVEARRPLLSADNFFVGGSPSTHHVGARRFSEVWYKQLYPGIDVVFRYSDEAGGGLKYDAIVAPSSDPTVVQIRYEGARRLTRTERGDLRIETQTDDFLEERPIVYQEVNGRRSQIEAKYQITDPTTLSYAVGSYDRSVPLVIDPRLTWSTFLGGSGTDSGLGIAASSDGGILITGFTRSSQFPTTTGAYDRIANGLDDAFVSKFDATGQLVFSTYLGGSNNDYGAAIASDAVGNVFVAGYTASTSFPTTPGAFDRTYGGGELDAFVTKLTPNGAGLVYSTYLGGAGYDGASVVIVDKSANAIVTGLTSSPAFPTTPGSFDPTYNGAFEGFVTRLNSDGSGITESSFLGGNSEDFILGSALDESGDRLFLGGSTQSVDFPTTASAYDTSFNGGQDGFVASYVLSTATLDFCTYIGGSYLDYGYTLTVDAMGRAFLGGETESFDFPLSPGAFDTELGGLTDGFIAKLNETGSALIFSTFLGGNASYDYVQSMAPLPDGSVLATGATLSIDFPVTSGIFGGSPYVGGVVDAYVTLLSKRGDAAAYSTCLGGTDGDAGYGILLGPGGRAITTGYTASPDYPTTNGAYDRSWNGGFDTYLTVLPVTAIGDVGKIAAVPSGPGLQLSVESPARTTISARVKSAASEELTLEVLDTAGRRIFRQEIRALSDGQVAVQIDPSKMGNRLATGIYYVRVISGSASTSRRVVFLR